MEMPDEKPAENNIQSTAEVVKGILDAEIVKDTVGEITRPAAKEIGAIGGTLVGLINTILLPLAMVNRFRQACFDDFNNRLTARVEQIPEDRRIDPPLRIAGPLLEGLRYNIEEPELREMYANLLASTMDISTIKEAHPRYINFLEQITPDEARIIAYLQNYDLIQGHDLQITSNTLNITAESVYPLAYVAECSVPEMNSIYVSNLISLGILEPGNKDIPKYSFGTLTFTDALFDQASKDIVRNLGREEGSNFRLGKYSTIYLVVSDLGRLFMKACLNDEG